MAQRKQICPSGQGLVEYVLLVALLVLASVLALDAAGISIPELYQQGVALVRGEAPVDPGEGECLQVVRASDEWHGFKDKFWRGGVEFENGRFEACPLCGATMGGFSGADFTLSLSGVQVENERKSWNGYGVVFRGAYTRQGYEGYMLEIERQAKNHPVQIYFSKWVRGVQIRPPLAAQNLPDFDWENPPSIQVQVAGDTFSASLNGEPALRAVDRTFTEGEVGVVSNSGTRTTFQEFNVQFDVCGEE